ncbi:DUF2191 domain-containing protein [Nocardia bovistercoris]|uniref:DUF2191 domain-containing protein n=1 Tax=Nocardia bovistercoris TaxID=2785916 RepID=A0A931I8Q6_9NOCA|nr:DUF2191 domain-containing protein [Nocardia bovistercoris]MBH0775978.1 DUF2191 domain-containing protein [Nocardia bovistercoris]
MTKRLVDLDDELLDAAKQELGTTGVSDTVRTALRAAVAAAARARHAEWLIEGGMKDMADPEQRSRVWR